MALRWYLTIQLWSLPFALWGSVLFQDLPDRGYAAAKFLGVMSVSLFTWLAFAWLGAPFEPWMPWIAWSLAMFGSFLNLTLDRRSRFVRGVSPASQLRFSDCMIVEGLYLCVFAGWVLVVAHDPGISHTEQPMDFMFLASLWNTTHFPPQDSWLSGFAISYYYFGYWMMATLAKASQVLPQIGYGLSTASWYGFLWLGVYTVAFNVTSLLGQTGDFKVNRRTYAWGAGLLSALSVASMGTLSGILEFLYAFGLISEKVANRFEIFNFPTLAVKTLDFFKSSGGWWWRSTRVIHDRTLLGEYLEVITEYPLFSYMLGDNHPHVMDSPVLLLGVLLLLQFMVQGQNWNSCDLTYRWWRLPSLKIRYGSFLANTGRLVLGAMLLAASMLTNTWDAVSLTILVSFGLAIFLFSTIRSVKFLVFSSACIGFGILALNSVVLFPHFLVLQSPVEGIQVNLFNPTRWQQLLLFWGPLLLVCPLLVGAVVSKKLFSWSLFSWTSMITLGISALLLAVGILQVRGLQIFDTSFLAPEGWEYVARQRWAQSLLSVTGIALLFSLMLTAFWSWWGKNVERQRGLAPLAHLAFCAALALGLIYFVEFLFIVDGFGRLMRMNTVFKSYYQAWPLLGIVLGTTVILVLAQEWKRPKFLLPMSGVVILMIACLAIPITSVISQLSSNVAPLTIDSRKHLSRSDPDLAEALDWIDENVGGGEILLEAPGLSYHVGHNRFSSLAGQPTLHGWGGHEMQWRGSSYSEMAQGRMEAADKIYKSGNPEQVDQALDKWNIAYVVVGPHEREKYGFATQRQELLVHLLNPVFESGKLQIFKVIG